MNQEAGAAGVSEISLPCRPLVFLGKTGWHGGTPLLKEILLFLGIENKEPRFFTSFQGSIQGFFSFVNVYRDLHSQVYLFFPEGACGEKVLEIIDRELPNDMTYEAFEIDQSGRFFRRGSSWSLSEEKEKVRIS